MSTGNLWSFKHYSPLRQPRDGAAMEVPGQAPCILWSSRSEPTRSSRQAQRDRVSSLTVGFPQVIDILPWTEESIEEEFIVCTRYGFLVIRALDG